MQEEKYRKQTNLENLKRSRACKEAEQRRRMQQCFGVKIV